MPNAEVINGVLKNGETIPIVQVDLAACEVLLVSCRRQEYYFELCYVPMYKNIPGTSQSDDRLWNARV